MRSLFVSLPLTTLLFLLVVVQSCAPNKESQQALESSIPENVELNVSLGSSSRAERFLGTFDEIDRLTLEYNRARQAAITRELVEIVAGAEAL